MYVIVHKLNICMTNKISMKLLLLLVAAVSFSNASEENIYSMKSHHMVKRSNDILSEESHLPRHVTPNSYRIVLKPLINEGYFRGQVQINISCHEATDTIVLHAHNDLQVAMIDIAIHSLGSWQDPEGSSSFKQLNHSHHYTRVPSSMPQHTVTIAKLERDLNKDWCQIMLKEKLRKGMMYQLKLEFSGNISLERTHAFYKRSYILPGSEKERWYMGTKLKYQFVRRVFPCFDELGFKASFQISIARPDNLKAITSMPRHSTEIIANQPGWKLDHFKATPPMSVESIGLVIFDPSDFIPVETVEIPGSVKIHGYAQSKLANEIQSIIDEVVETIQFIESYTGIAFPAPELHLLAIPGVLAWGQESGLLVFGDEDMGSISSSIYLAHSLVTHWIGDLITPESESNIPFMEGMQTCLLINTLQGIGKHIERFSVGDWRSDIAHQFFHRHSSLNEINEMELQIFWLIRMLNSTLTESTFRFGIHSFLHERAYKSFNEDDFFEALNNQAWLDGVLPLFVSIQDIAKTWLQERRFPVVTVTRHYLNNTATIEQHTFIREWPYHLERQNKSLWWVPIMYLTRSNLDVNSVEAIAWMREEKQITIRNLPNKDSFIIVNPENLGLFMVNYDHTNWYLLSQYLMESALNNNLSLIPPVTRSKLLHDSALLAVGGELDYPTAFDMMQFIRHDKEITVWKAMLDIFDYLLRELRYTPVYEKFLAHCRYLFAPGGNYFLEQNYTRPLQKVFLRRLAGVLAFVRYEPALERAKSQYRLQLEEFISGNLNSMSARAVLRYSDEDWELGFRKALGILAINGSVGDDNRFLFTLVSCARNPQNLNRVLTLLLLSNNVTLNDEEVKSVFTSVEDPFIFINFISEHYDALKSRFADKSKLWNSMFEEATGNFKTEEGLHLVSQLYNNRKDSLGSAKGIVESSYATISENISNKYKFIADINTWLDKHTLTYFA